MSSHRPIHARPFTAARSGGRGLRQLWPALPEREIEIDGTDRDTWRIVRHRGAVLGRVFAAPGGEFVFYRGPFNVTHETYTADSLAGLARAIRALP